MLPHAYELPATVLLVLGGAVACFAGYRLFRIVLAVYGFILGAMLASSVMGISNSVAMVVAAIAGGIVGAAILIFAYFVGIALVGAGMGAVVAHIAWAAWRAPSAGPAPVPDPPLVLVVVLASLGAFIAMLLQRYVIIVGTSFGGAWTMIVGGLALAGDRGAEKAASAGNVWILYPMTPAPGRRWVPIVWIALGLIGMGVQLTLTGRKR